MILSKGQFEDLLAERLALDAKLRQGVQARPKEAESAELPV